MKAFVLGAPGVSEVREVLDPVADVGHVVVEVARVGICGTDTEFFSGEMEYIRQGHSHYPMVLGHEWCGTVIAVGDAVDPTWLGRRVTGDTMLGCGECHRCLAGRHHVCARRSELGIRGTYPGALAERLRVPAVSLHALPDAVTDTGGAMVEPGGNSWRSFEAAQVSRGERLLVIGPGTIGLLVAEFAVAQGVDVHLAGRGGPSMGFASSLDLGSTSPLGNLPELRFDGVVDASNSESVPARAVELVEPGRRVVFVGLSGTPSLVDSRDIALKDVTTVGILGASAGLDGTIEAYASGAVDPGRLVATVVGLHQVHDALAGSRPSGAGPGPKIHVDPRITP